MQETEHEEVHRTEQHKVTEQEVEQHQDDLICEKRCSNEQQRHLQSHLLKLPIPKCHFPHQEQLFFFSFKKKDFLSFFFPFHLIVGARLLQGLPQQDQGLQVQSTNAEPSEQRHRDLEAT